MYMYTQKTVLLLRFRLATHAHAVETPAAPPPTAFQSVLASFSAPPFEQAYR